MTRYQLSMLYQANVKLFSGIAPQIQSLIERQVQVRQERDEH